MAAGELQVSKEYKTLRPGRYNSACNTIMQQQPPKLGKLRTQLYEDKRWETVNVELTEEHLMVKQRDVVYEDIMASNEIVDERFVTLRRKNSKFGVCIQGGLDYKCPIKINTILEDTPASQCGEMDIFNIILEVNGLSMWGRSHSEASKIIQESGEEVTFHIGNLIERCEQIPVDEKWLTIANVPIQMSSLTKYKPGTDILRPNIFEVTSRDGRAKTTLLCEEDEYSDWIDTITRHIERNTELEIESYNSNASREEQIVKMGWVYEDLPSTEHTDAWCRKLLVLKRTCIQLFDTMPDNIDEWERPEQAYNLLEMTVQVLPTLFVQYQRENSLVLTSGTGSSHVISCETGEGLISWTKDIHHATIKAVKSTKHVQYSGICQGREVYLVLDIHRGILVLSCDNIDPSHILWKRSFSHVRHSSDDGHTKLKLACSVNPTTMATEELVIELEDLQLAICGLECFMVTKVAMLDPQFIQEKTDIIA